MKISKLPSPFNNFFNLFELTGKKKNFLNSIKAYKNLNLEQKKDCNDRLSNFLSCIEDITWHSEFTVHKCFVVTHTKKEI